MISGDLKYDHGRNKTVSGVPEPRNPRKPSFTGRGESGGAEPLSKGRGQDNKANRGETAKGRGHGGVNTRPFTRYPLVTLGGYKLLPLVRESYAARGIQHTYA